MNNLVVSPLHKAGIDVAERYQTLGGQARRKGNGMLLGNTDIKSPIGHGFHHDVHRRA
ncbi:hypothetical protein D9M68_650560 [compost metagenome]